MTQSPKRCGCVAWFRTCWQHWTAIEDVPTLEIDDLDEFRPEKAAAVVKEPPLETKFIIQFQATHKDNFGDVLTQAQLVPVTRSVYGTIRFAYPLARTGYHDPQRGTYTVLAYALPNTFKAWADHDKWPHINAHLLGNYWNVVLVAEVGLRCETAQSGLDSVGLATSSTSASE
jgi:hypothetical protein